MKRIKIFDTTLRDGEQSPGCSMDLTEKIDIHRARTNSIPLQKNSGQVAHALPC